LRLEHTAGHSPRNNNTAPSTGWASAPPSTSSPRASFSP
jgi:hypothetical protein